METVLTRDKVWNMLTEFNKEYFHIKHALTVEGGYASDQQHLNYENESKNFKRISDLMRL